MIAIRIHETGGAEKLRSDEIDLPSPGAGEVRIRVDAAGLNFIDIYKRNGLYAVKLPHTLGQEAAGVVTALGSGVTGINVGDRVASTAVNGAYAAEATVPAAQCVKIPEGVSTAEAAAVMLQGMTAHYLASDTFPLQPNQSALVHAGAGGVGLLLIQIAKFRGARVLATVGTEEKARLAREAGADGICLYTQENFTEAARAFTHGKGVDVVYDSIGKDTFDASLNSLRPRGMMVSYGNSSGPVPPFSPLLLSQRGSLYLARPTLLHYTATPEELNARASDLFTWMREGKLKVRIGSTFPLRQAADAHRALESRATTGKVLLLP